MIVYRIKLREMYRVGQDWTHDRAASNAYSTYELAKKAYNDARLFGTGAAIVSEDAEHSLLR